MSEWMYGRMGRWMKREGKRVRGRKEGRSLEDYNRRRRLQQNFIGMYTAK